jgi:hypothetical protein
MRATSWSYDQLISSPNIVQRQSESGPRGDIASVMTRLPTWVEELILRPSASLRLSQRVRFESENPPFRPRSVALTRLLVACFLFPAAVGRLFAQGPDVLTWRYDNTHQDQLPPAQQQCGFR